MDFPIRFISGEPGRGKSSFAKMLAAGLAEDLPEAVNVMLVSARDLDGWNNPDVSTVTGRAIRCLTYSPRGGANLIP